MALVDSEAFSNVQDWYLVQNPLQTLFRILDTGTVGKILEFNDPIRRDKIECFDAINRTDLDSATHTVPAFDYLNSSARPEAVEIRNQVDRMLARYPAQYRAGLEGRFRAPDDVAGKGAFFELLIHGICLHAGYAVLEIEPKIENSKHRPDFLLQTPLGLRFYLEVTTATGQSVEDAAAEKALE
jgi:hypothetical protein